MKSKKQINIMGEIWNITYCDEYVDLDVFSDCQGICIPQKQEIRIYDKMSQERKEEVLIHEIMHAIIIRLNICDLFGENEEKIVTKLATGIYDTFKRNRFLK
jgi:hypothetical protein